MYWLMLLCQTPFDCDPFDLNVIEFSKIKHSLVKISHNLVEISFKAVIFPESAKLALIRPKMKCGK